MLSLLYVLMIFMRSGIAAIYISASFFHFYLFHDRFLRASFDVQELFVKLHSWDC